MIKSISHTFRIDKETSDIFVGEASRQNTSLNSLINQILKRYARYDRFVIRSHDMRFPVPIMSAIFADLSNDHIEELGRRIGESHPKDLLRTTGLGIDFSCLLRVLSDDAYWFVLETSTGPDGLIFHLKNEVGGKWSYFLKGYMVSAATKVFALSITTEMTEFSLTIKVPSLPISNDLPFLLQC